MYQVPIKESLHDWEKKNLVTKVSGKGGYDEMVCRNCGMKGRRYMLSVMSVSGSYSRERAFTCPKAPEQIKPTQIEITYCDAQGKIFENITPGSVHNVVSAPEPYKDDGAGVWVMGNGEPVKILNREFKKIK